MTTQDIKKRNESLVRVHYDSSKTLKQISDKIKAEEGVYIHVDLISKIAKRLKIISKDEGHNAARYNNRRKKEGVVEDVYEEPVVMTTTFKKLDHDFKKIIAISCQAKTNTNRTFLNNLKLYIKHNKIDGVFVIPMFGEVVNFKEKPVVEKTIIEELESASKKVKVVVVDNNFILNKNVSIGNAYQRPQKQNPLLGLARVSQHAGLTIFGGTKIGLETIGTTKEFPRVITSTGALTKPNYLNSSPGSIARELHKYGFVTLDLTKDGYLNFRTVEVDGNSIYDLTKRYHKGEVTNIRPTALSTPDIHHTQACPKRLSKLEDYMTILNAEKIFYHDLLDCLSISHHDNNNLYKLFKKAKKGLTFEREIKDTCAYLNKMVSKFSLANHYIVRSNHDAHQDKWAEELKTSVDRTNPVDYPWLAFMFFKKCWGDDDINLFEECWKHLGYHCDRLKFLKTKETVKIGDVILSCHGYDGVNGTKGTPQGFERTGVKYTIGDKHSPKILGNIYVTGVTINPLSNGYWTNNGLSGWLNACVIQHENGTRQMIIIY